MALDTRWPEFSLLASELGVRSLLSFQLFVVGENLGALNIYAGEAGVFSDESIEVGTLVAQHAAVALSGSISESQFQSALATQDVIGQAKGILMLMQRENLTGLQAFELLAKASKETHITLVDVARWLVSEHENGVTPS